MHILRCACSRTSFEGGDATVNIHEKLLKLNIPPYAHTPLRQLADFLRRGRCDGQDTRALRRGDITVCIHEH